MSKKLLLTIIDGWGIGPESDNNAIMNAETPNYDRLIREYPNTSLHSSGESVGLPEGQAGTSEVNHLTIGAGRILRQELPLINHQIKTGKFFENPQLLETIEFAKEHKGNLQLIGLLSDGGIHSHIEHLFALLKLINNLKFTGKVFLHLFSDGRDVVARSVEKYLTQLEKEIAKYPNLKISIASLQGRVYLDRDRNWERTQSAVDLMLADNGIFQDNWQSAVNYAYNQVDNDQNIPQYLLDKNSGIKTNDAVICFNFRTDRIYQLLSKILQLPKIKVCSFISPSDDFTDLLVAFPKHKVEHTLAETLSNHEKKQLHITETEKYPHVTYFFNGEREQELPGEEWKLFPSNRYVNSKYQIEPSMQDFVITNEIIERLQDDNEDFIISNLCSPDMVGHTGDYNGAIVSSQAIDYCLGKIYEQIETQLSDWTWIITADHGNAEEMWDKDADQPHTRHTLNKVPLILVSKDDDQSLGRNRGLDDIAPTILEIMNISKPKEMTGESLILK